MRLTKLRISRTALLLGRRVHGKIRCEAGPACRGLSRVFLRENSKLPISGCLLACVFFAAAAYGQTAPAQNTASPNQVHAANAGNPLPDGTTICVVLDNTIDAKKAKVGDAILAKTTMAVLAHGKVLIATGAKIKGHITEAKPRSKEDTKSEVGIVFDRFVAKDGGELPLPLTVQAIGYGGLSSLVDSDFGPGAHAPYSTAASAASDAAAGTSRRSGFPPPRPESSDGPNVESPGHSDRTPALDAGSKGAVGLSGLTLTEGHDVKHGSVITGTKKNVKLERGSQLILRVIEEPKDSGEGK